MDGSLRHLAAIGSAEFATGERCHITELVNHPSLPAFSLARARVEPGVTTQLHALAVREVYVVLSGHGEMAGGTGQRFTIGPGDAVDIPAGSPQQVTNTGGEDLVFLCLCHPRFEPAGYRPLGP